MSGGHWGYSNDSLCDEVTGCYPDYGMGDAEYTKSAKYVRKQNLLGDKQISELVYDVFCLLHSYDWYICSDTCEETYLKDVAYFKKKWFKKPDFLDVKKEIDAEIEAVKESLYKEFRYAIEEKEN